MRATEVGCENWKTFAAEFTRQHSGWPIVIETPGRHRGSLPEVVTLPFRALELDVDHQIATLVLGDEPDRYVTYSIAGVKALMVESSRERSESSIRIESNEGMVTLLHFELADVGVLQEEL